MLQSMTGYGSTSFQIDELEIYIELKTLNSRYFDSKISILLLHRTKILENGHMCTELYLPLRTYNWIFYTQRESAKLEFIWNFFPAFFFP